MIILRKGKYAYEKYKRSKTFFRNSGWYVSDFLAFLFSTQNPVCKLTLQAAQIVDKVYSSIINI